MKKTIHVKDLVGIVNRRNKFSTCTCEERAGWNSLLEEVLHQIEQYRGFNYLTEKEVPGVFKAGIRTDENGSVCEDYEERFKDTDETRRFYYSKD